MATVRKSSTSTARPAVNVKQDNSQKNITELEDKVLLLESQVAELKALLISAQAKTDKDLQTLSEKIGAPSGAQDHSDLAGQVAQNRKNLRSLGYR